eukprot:1157430-Pelagomonas_calceolata.AAC.3
MKGFGSLSHNKCNAYLTARSFCAFPSPCRGDGKFLSKEGKLSQKRWYPKQNMGACDQMWKPLKATGSFSSLRKDVLQTGQLEYSEKRLTRLEKLCK